MRMRNHLKRVKEKSEVKPHGTPLEKENTERAVKIEPQKMLPSDCLASKIKKIPIIKKSRKKWNCDWKPQEWFCQLRGESKKSRKQAIAVQVVGT